MQYPLIFEQKRFHHLLFAFIFVITLNSCSSSIQVKTCAPNIKSFWGTGDVHRMRNSEYRIEFEHPGNAADRFLIHAALAHLSYYDLGNSCTEPGRDKTDFETYKNVIDIVTTAGWEQVTEHVSQCNDDSGLFYGAWIKRAKTDIENHQVMLVYRGTENSTIKDWIYGNFRWFTRFLDIKNQYPRSREKTEALITYIKNDVLGDENNIDFYTVGHSLGGGLAQNILYHFPYTIKQAITFNPSPVTMFTDQKQLPKKQMAGCDCNRETLNDEARIYRIYESGEILGHIRYPLKLAINIARHVNEIRFAFDKGSTVKQHSMYAMYYQMSELAKQKDGSNQPWYKAKDIDGKNCTALFQQAHERLCQIETNERFVCPGI